MDAVAGLDQARQAYRQRAWERAYALFAEVDASDPLAPADLEIAAESADMFGRGDDAVQLLRRAYLAYAGTGDVAAALRNAYWLCKALAWGGEYAQAGAWRARARQLADAHPDCPDRAYLLLLDGEDLIRAGAHAELLATGRRLSELCGGGPDPFLAVGATMMLGHALIATGEIKSGLAHLDEAMVAVTAGELSPRATGMIYCVVIGACQELHELRRAREWTTALTDWCDAQPDFTGAYRGLCRVHRVAIMQMGGGWSSADREARLACQQLTGRYGQVVAGGAFYQLAELHRLRGETGDAERAYGDAVRHGWDAQPGMALLRLAQGRRDAAAAAIRRALAEATEAPQRARLLPAAVEILLAAGDSEGAGRAAAELGDIAARYDTTALHAMAAHAIGATDVAAGRAAEALTSLRRACRRWHDLEVPYEVARTRVLIAQACRMLDDEDSAAMELDAADDVFTRLGAATDAARVRSLRRAAAPAGGLSARELQVLRLLAAGHTNHAIAQELFLSEKTVARHVSNIFGKLGVASRTAAAAYGYEHGLV